MRGALIALEIPAQSLDESSVRLCGALRNIELAVGLLHALVAKNDDGDGAAEGCGT